MTANLAASVDAPTRVYLRWLRLREGVLVSDNGP